MENIFLMTEFWYQNYTLNTAFADSIHGAVDIGTLFNDVVLTAADFECQCY
jgi:hypothetical protein